VNGRDERGSGTVVALIAVTVLLFVTTALAGATGLVVAQRRAQAAADLVALAGAHGHASGRDACAGAAAVAGHNHSRLVSCRLVGDDVWVEVSVFGPRLLGRRHDVCAQARAGPGP